MVVTWDLRSLRFQKAYDRRLEDLVSQRPRWVLATLTLATFFVVTVGDFDDTDTRARLQVTHWLWSDQPQVDDFDAAHSIPKNPTDWTIAWSPGYCSLTGKDKQIYAQFSLGQSLLMLPADIAAVSAIGNFEEYFDFEGTDHTLFKQEIVVNLLTFSVMNTLAVIFSFDLLLLLGFTQQQSIVACLLLVFGTPFIVYMQDSAETNQIYLLYVGALLFVLKARQGKISSNCLIAGAFAGFNILMKLPNVVFVPAAMSVFLFSQARGLASWQMPRRGALKRDDVRWLLWFLVPVGVCIFIDRWYQFYRFGDWFSTYMTQCVESYAAAGGYPERFPFGYDRLAGFLGPFWSPDRSLFLYSPFLIFTVIFLTKNWTRVSTPQRAVVMASFGALVGLALIYGGTYHWNGGCGSWGPRHHLPPTEVLCLLGFAFAARAFPSYRPLRKTLVALNLAAALGCQAIALPYPPPLDNQESFYNDPLRAVPLLRARNIYYLLTDDILESAESFDDPSVKWAAENNRKNAPYSFWWWIARANSKQWPPLAWAIVTAWLMLAMGVAVTAAQLCIAGFRSSGAKEPGIDAARAFTSNR